RPQAIPRRTGGRLVTRRWPKPLVPSLWPGQFPGRPAPGRFIWLALAIRSTRALLLARAIWPARARQFPLALLLASALGLAGTGLAAAAPEGTMTWAVHVTLAPRWLDPAETESAITPFMVLYPLHDALVKLMPGGMQPSLAESWTVSADGLA